MCKYTCLRGGRDLKGLRLKYNTYTYFQTTECQGKFLYITKTNIVWIEFYLFCIYKAHKFSRVCYANQYHKDDWISLSSWLLWRSSICRDWTATLYSWLVSVWSTVDRVFNRDNFRSSQSPFYKINKDYLSRKFRESIIG